MNYEKIGIWVIAAFMVPITLIGFYTLFIILPVTLYTEAECLRKGYPKYHVTIGLERYCSNLSGSITVKVDKAGK